MKASKTKKNQGQMTLLIAMMSITLLLLFAFVVNTAMLVNAKINLQNAADLAAYAGASAQARQLNEIALLNYEMRRAYKKFLFQYYVLGTLAQDSFPRSQNPPPQDALRSYFPRNNGSTDYTVPVTCVVLNEAQGVSNNCRVENLTNLTQPINPTDPISDALSKSIEKLETDRQQACKVSGLVNQLVLNKWLYGVRLNPSPPPCTQSDIMCEIINHRLPALISEMGLVPRLALLANRISTLEEYVNRPPVSINGGSELQAIELESTQSAPWRERTVSAFRSALWTLGEYSFPDPEQITFTELLPSSGDKANLLTLLPGTINFDVFFLDYILPPTSSQQVTFADCRAYARKLLLPTTTSGQTGLTVGFWKAPEPTVYYAVKLEAKARLLFSFLGQNLTLRAYAAAKPFGSRIGPPIRQSEWTHSFGNTLPIASTCTQTIGQSCVGAVPNLPILLDDQIDQSGVKEGFNRLLVQYALSRQIGATFNNAGTIPPVIGGDAIRGALHAAAAPFKWELGKYTIANDLDSLNSDDSTVGAPSFGRFESFFQRNSVPTGNYRIFAPLDFSEVRPQQISDQTLQNIANQFSSNLFLDQNGNPPAPGSLEDSLAHHLLTETLSYLDDLNTGPSATTPTQDNESYEIFEIQNPFFNYASSSSSATAFNQSQNTAQFMSLLLSNPSTGANMKDTRWAYSPDFDRPGGRTGYSVKFVPFQTLRALENPVTDPSLSSGSNSDLQKIQH